MEGGLLFSLGGKMENNEKGASYSVFPDIDSLTKNDPVDIPIEIPLDLIRRQAEQLDQFDIEQEHSIDFVFSVGSFLEVRASASGPAASKQVKNMVTFSTGTNSSPMAMADDLKKACVRNINEDTKVKRATWIRLCFGIVGDAVCVVLIPLVLLGGYSLIKSGYGLSGAIFSGLGCLALVGYLGLQRTSAFKVLGSIIKDSITTKDQPGN